MRKQAYLLVLLSLGACKSSESETKKDPPPTQQETPASQPGAQPEAAAQPEKPVPPGLDMSVMDATADPCNDFYQYACGGWLKSAEIPADKPIFSRGFVTITDSNQQVLKQLLEAIAAGKAPEGTPYAKQLGDFYGTCMDDTKVEAGTALVTKELKAIKKVKNGKAAMKLVTAWHQKGIWPFFDVSSAQDFKDATRVLAVLDQGGLGLPDRSYYLSKEELAKEQAAEAAAKPADAKPADAKPADAKPADAKPADAKPADAKPADAKPADAKPADAKPADAKPADAKPADAKPADAKPGDAKPADAKPADASEKTQEQKIREAYVEYLTQLQVLAGAKEPAARKDAEAVLALETELARASQSKKNRRNPDNIYHLTDVKALKKLAPAVAWPAYFKALKLPPKVPINVTHEPFFARLSAILAKTKGPVLQAYLRTTLLRSTAQYLGKPFVAQHFAMVQKLTGQKEDLPRWKKCVQMTDRAMGEALAVPFVKDHFGEDGKATTQDMVKTVEAAFEQNLASLGWMDQATKDKASQKLKAIINKIGYPDTWRKYDSLKIASGPFVANVLAAKTFEVRRDLNKIGKPVDKNEWYMSPPTVNAYYNEQVNEIVFPAGILQPPFFNREATAAVNYGAMGMVVGHEITHGFDDQGSKFDAVGNRTDWWTEADRTKFETRTQCLVKQYQTYSWAGEDGVTPQDNAKLNGELTLGENTADLGGIKLAYMAMETATKDNAALDEFRFNRAQQFFLGYAQSWCTKARAEQGQMRAKVDPHSPPQWRVNGVLANTAAFHEAFQCKPDAPMVRPAADRCEVW